MAPKRFEITCAAYLWLTLYFYWTTLSKSSEKAHCKDIVLNYFFMHYLI